MSLEDYQKQKFSILHSNYVKMLNILHTQNIDSNDETTINLIKQINNTLDALTIDLEDLQYHLLHKKDISNVYLKNKSNDFKNRQKIINNIIPFAIQMHLQMSQNNI